MKKSKNNTAASTHVVGCGLPLTKYHVNDIVSNGYEKFTIVRIEVAKFNPWHVETIYWLKDKHGRERYALQSICENMTLVYDAVAAELAVWKHSAFEFTLWESVGNCSKSIATYPNGKEAFKALENIAKENDTEVVFENGTEFGDAPACWAWGVCVNEKAYYLTVEG